MQVYETGQIIPSLRGQPDGVRFDLTDEGAILQVLMARPTANEINAVSAGQTFEIAFVERPDMLIMLVKFGSTPWMDAPYTPHLSTHLTRLQEVPEGIGYSVLIVLVDTAVGKIVHQRLVGLSTRFSRALKSAVASLMLTTFDKAVYAQSVQNYQKRTTKEYVAMALHRCKI